jgi:superfamily I DNA/RNA helicase
MNTQDLVNNLTATIAANVASVPAVQKALATFHSIGLRVVEIRIERVFVLTQQIIVAEELRDRAFLRGLRILPNVSTKEGKN